MKKYKIELDDQEINHIKNQLAADIDRYKKAINEAKSDDVKTELNTDLAFIERLAERIELMKNGIL